MNEIEIIREKDIARDLIYCEKCDEYATKRIEIGGVGSWHGHEIDLCDWCYDQWPEIYEDHCECERDHILETLRGPER
jgi:hypothetical protein